MADQAETWERWQFADFDTPGNPALQTRAGGTAPTAVDAPDPHIQAQIEQLRESARQAGYAAGQEAGYAAGYAQGQAQAQNEARQIGVLAGGFSQALQDIDQQLAQDLLSLSIEIARRIIQQNLHIQPEQVLDVLHQALAQLGQTQATVTLHPEDARLLRAHLVEDETGTGITSGFTLHILEDARLHRGGCKVEAAGSQIDATLENRWHRVLDTLGAGLGAEHKLDVATTQAALTTPPQNEETTPEDTDEHTEP